MRILVTGSRDWDDERTIFAALKLARRDYDPDAIPTVVHGACVYGGDVIAHKAARRLGWQVEAHPADWKQYGKRAGFLRNAEMVKAGADICLAFIKNNSHGATHCADLAERAGIPVRRYLAFYVYLPDHALSR